MRSNKAIKNKEVERTNERTCCGISPLSVPTADMIEQSVVDAGGSEELTEAAGNDLSITLGNFLEGVGLRRSGEFWPLGQ